MHGSFLNGLCAASPALFYEKNIHVAGPICNLAEALRVTG